nr:PilN domain-containing protein [Mitsuokella multacida]
MLFAELAAEGGTLLLVRTAVERLDGGLTLAEVAAMRAQREGWHELDFAACLPAAQVRFYETELPPHMEASEWREAAHWELDAHLTDEGLEADAYAMACRREGAGRVVLAAAEREMLARLAEDFREQGLSLRGIAALPPGTASSMAASLDGQGLALSEAQRAFVPAIAAAQSVLREDGLQLWGSAVQGRRLRCRRLAALCCTVTFFVLFATAFFDMRAYLEAKRDYQHEEKAFLVLQREEKIMQLTGRLQQKIRARDAKAAAVMGDAVPWYSVMVHLGRPELQTEGVWLRSILLRSDKKVELCGAALSYAALSVFLQSFEADRAFFPQGPVLEASEEGKDAEKNRIAFRISIGI